MTRHVSAAPWMSKYLSWGLEEEAKANVALVKKKGSINDRNFIIEIVHAQSFCSGQISMSAESTPEGLVVGNRLGIAGRARY